MNNILPDFVTLSEQLTFAPCCSRRWTISAWPRPAAQIMGYTLYCWGIGKGSVLHMFVYARAAYTVQCISSLYEHMESLNPLYFYYIGTSQKVYTDVGQSGVCGNNLRT